MSDQNSFKEFYDLCEKRRLKAEAAMRKKWAEAAAIFDPLDEVSPPGWEGTVKAMKKHKDIDNPWALSWWMKNKGYKSHKKKDGTEK